MEEKEINKMSEQEVIDVVSMANNMYSNYANGNFFGLFTPDLLNQNLNSLNNNPSIPTKITLDNALKNYKYQANELKAFSEYAEVYDSLFGKILNYYANLLSFDLHITCKNAYLGELDYQSEEFKKDKKIVYKFLDNFNDKDEFLKVIKELIRGEIYYTWLRDSQGTFENTGDIEIESIKKLSSYTLQIMPQDRCKVTGMWENGLLYDFDMTYFLRAGVDINSYDPCFKKYFANTFGDNATPKYNPTSSLNNRNGTYAMWTQTSPDDSAWAFKFDMSNMNTTPFLSSMIKQVLSTDEVAKLQIDSNMLSARGILAGQIPMLDKQKSGQTKNAMAWETKTLEKFMRLVKMGLTNNLNAVAMPTETNDFYQFENKNPDMLGKQMKISSGNGVSASRLIYSEDKMSEAEIQNAIVTDYNLMKRLYPQFEKFLGFFINKKTRKYKFDFHYDGCTYPFMREKANKALFDLADRGMVLDSGVYSKCVDMKPQEFDRALEEGKYSKWTENLLSQLLSIHTQSGNEETGGAPKKESSDLKESGSVAREYD